MRQIRDGFRNDLMRYLELSDPALADYLMIFIDGLIVQFIYQRGIDDRDWYQQQYQFMMQMVLHYAQSPASSPA